MTGPIKMISELDREKLDSELTLDEVSKTLENTHNNVAPGSGGITGAFHKVFRCNAGAVRLGLIALIPKGNMDKRYISN